MKKTINVPLDELKPGDAVMIPPLTVIATLHGNPPFVQFRNGEWDSFDWLERLGATATREVEEPEYPLTWAEALDAMVTGGKVCASDYAPQYRYRFNGRFEFKPGDDDGWNLWGSPSSAYGYAKWRIVEESE